MIEWRAEGLVLAVRRLGENDVVLDALTEDRGRHAGAVKGGGGRRLAPLMQPGARLDLTWRARIEDQLGRYGVEPVRSRAQILSDPDALAGLGALTSLLAFALPERERQPGLLAATEAVIGLMEEGTDWPIAYLRWELALLGRLGFALDLSRCAITGATHDLSHISPRTGRAVTRAGAGDWADRLLPLPRALLETVEDPHEIATGLRVTGHFLQARLAPHGERPLPAARDRLIRRLDRRA